MAKRKRYEALVKIEISMQVPIHGDSLEDALALARKLRPTDAIDFDASRTNDASIEVEGVFS